VTALKERLAEAKGDLATETEKYQALVGALSALQASLKALDKGLGEMSETQRTDAAELRKLQMQMLDKVEAYEKEKREQSGELARIVALLAGQRSEQETIKLTIRSLNLSVAALKAAQKIIIELSGFFSSFASFMDSVTSEISGDVKRLEKIANAKSIPQYQLKIFIAAGDKFFVRQAAEWHAVRMVTARFEESFAEGWSTLNNLRGKYFQDFELDAYLKEAAAELERIANERAAAAQAKVIDLNKIRTELETGTAA
jgi:hypothetical protein